MRRQQTFYRPSTPVLTFSCEDEETEAKRVLETLPGTQAAALSLPDEGRFQGRLRSWKFGVFIPQLGPSSPGGPPLSLARTGEPPPSSPKPLAQAEEQGSPGANQSSSLRTSKGTTGSFPPDSSHRDPGAPRRGLGGSGGWGSRALCPPQPGQIFFGLPFIWPSHSILLEQKVMKNLQNSLKTTALRHEAFVQKEGH